MRYDTPTNSRVYCRWSTAEASAAIEWEWYLIRKWFVVFGSGDSDDWLEDVVPPRTRITVYYTVCDYARFWGIRVSRYKFHAMPERDSLPLNGHWLGIGNRWLMSARMCVRIFIYLLFFLRFYVARPRSRQRPPPSRPGNVTERSTSKKKKKYRTRK